LTGSSCGSSATSSTAPRRSERLRACSFQRGYWLNRFFPGIQAIDLARFPTEEQLRGELTGAGLGSVRFERLSQHASLPRETALERIRGRHISTFDLLDDDEIREGIARAERELPDPVEYDQEWLIAIGAER